MSNLLAAVGRAQLERLPLMLERRRQWRLRYRSLFADVPGVTVFGGEDGSESSDPQTRDNFWLTSILVDPSVAGWTAEDLRVALADRDIEARPLWKPMHLQPVYADAPSYTSGVSERLFRTGLSLPSGSALSDEHFGRIEDSVADLVWDRT
jgi:dTDP-4-amino-4,6-dideoxygalactose transaminase